MEKIGLIIPIHNGLEFTQKCLDNLYENNKTNRMFDKHMEIIVVDDGSTDGSKEWIKKNHPRVKVLDGDGNLWWSGAINCGAEYAINELKTDYILLWNNDIVPDNNYFKELFNIIQTTDTKTIIGSKIFTDSSFKRIWSMGGIFNPKDGRKYMIGLNANDSVKYSEIVNVDWLPGMGTLIHKCLIDTIGLWDNINFPQYHGDSDFTYRAKLAGFKIVVYPELRIWNDKSNSGMLHNGKIRQLFQSLKDIKSNFNIKKDYIFYKKYSQTNKAYLQLFRKYYTYVGGFFKWKLLNLLGIKKPQLMQ